MGRRVPPRVLLLDQFTSICFGFFCVLSVDRSTPAIHLGIIGIDLFPIPIVRFVDFRFGTASSFKRSHNAHQSVLFWCWFHRLVSSCGGITRRLFTCIYNMLFCGVGALGIRCRGVLSLLNWQAESTPRLYCRLYCFHTLPRAQRLSASSNESPRLR